MHGMRPKSTLGRIFERIAWVTYFNWMVDYNFSGQDNAAAAPVRYWTEEHLSSTDSFLVFWRKLVAEGSRDVLRRSAKRNGQVPEGETPAEEESYQHQQEVGMTVGTKP